MANQLIFLLLLSMLTACVPPKAPMQLNNDTQQSIQNDTQDKRTVSKHAETDKSIKSIHTATDPQHLPSSWELSGAMAARNKNKSLSASVHWLEHGESNYQIRLSGPIGSGTILIERHGGLVSYRDGPKSITSASADELLQQQTGVQLPVNKLYYWVRGLPAPGAVNSIKRDASNRVILLHQAGFTINYLGYTQVNNNALPNLIKLQGNGVFIKLVIKHWKI